MKTALLLLTLCASCNCTVPAPPPAMHVISPSSPSLPAEEVTCDLHLLFLWLDSKSAKILCPYLEAKLFITFAIWVTLCMDGITEAWLLGIIVYNMVSKETYERWWKSRNALPAIVSFYIVSVVIAWFVAEIYLLAYICLLCVHMFDCVRN